MIVQSIKEMHSVQLVISPDFLRSYTNRSPLYQATGWQRTLRDLLRPSGASSGRTGKTQSTLKHTSPG